MKIQRIIAGAAFAGLVATMTACSAGGGASSSGSVNWWTWDEKQAASYEKCLPGFEKANPDISVTISQYAVDDYFTKLTAGFVSGSAPDAFQNSVPLLGAYAGQGQIMALDDLIAKSGFDTSVFSVGLDSWKYTDGKQYGLPLDWAAAAFYFNQDDVTAAGYTADDIKNMTFDPADGGTFGQIVAHLTVDANGVRGDEAGFDKNNVATYGVGSLASGDFNGQTSWNGLVSSTGWRLGDKAAWPTKFNYDDPTFIQTLDYVRGLADKGYAPQFGAFTVSGAEQLGSGKVAMVEGGSWDVTTMAKVPGLTVGVAFMPSGSDGRSVISNSNANNIFVGTKNLDATWKWVTYMGSEACQSAAGVDGTFLPSIAASMQVAADAQAAQGVDLSPFTDALANGELYAAPPTANGQEMSDAITPLFEAYFSHERDDDVFAEMTAKTEEIFAK
ncbi:MAG: sugar transporter substrate-binding protein [Rhodoglobus sp.]|jgi:multiple sugar transport system substrate-binding protein|nr:sugar transporter substrate-binding protein [Rhodoglobus sp.]